MPRVGTPDAESFRSAYELLAALHDEVWRQTGIDPARTVLGGFSMGTVMSYALGLAPDRPRPGGIMAFSGVPPTVEGWQPDLAGRRGLPTFIAHGARDEVIDVSFARRARELLEAGGLAVEYHESEAGHHIDPRELPAAAAWLARTLPASPPPRASALAREAAKVRSASRERFAEEGASMSAAAASRERMSERDLGGPRRRAPGFGGIAAAIELGRTASPIVTMLEQRARARWHVVR